MFRCPSCGKWTLKRGRYCPSCHADLWEAEAVKRLENPSALMEEAAALMKRGEEEKAGVWASMAVTEMMNEGESVSFARLRRAVRELARIYEGSGGPVADETMADALDYLEERAEQSGEEQYTEEVTRLREQLTDLYPEAAPVTEKSLNLAWERDTWKLPMPESLTEQSDYSGFTPDLTQTKGLSVIEMAYFQYLQFPQVCAVLEGRAGDNASFLRALFPQDTIPPEDAGPAAPVLEALMEHLSPAGYAAWKRLYRKDAPESFAADLSDLRSACQSAAQDVGLFPEELMFTALMTPLLALPGAQGRAVYEAVEPGVQRLLHLRSSCLTGSFGFLHPAEQAGSAAEPAFSPAGEDTGEKAGEEQTLSAPQPEEEKKPAPQEDPQQAAERRKIEDAVYGRQLLQTFTSEFCALYGVLEYEAALACRLPQRGMYRKLLAQAAGSGLSLACRDEARNWFSGDNGYESDPGYARFYTQILSMRGLNYPIVSFVRDLKDVQMKVPGIPDEE